MFVRVYRHAEGKEILFNTSFISKIEVEYVVPNPSAGPDQYCAIGLSEGLKNPNAVRWYRVHVAGEVYKLLANPNDPVMKVIDDIYRDAIKGNY